MERALLLATAVGGVMAAGAWACGNGLAQLDCATTIPVFVHVDPALAAGSLTTVDGGCTSPKCSRVLDSGGCQDWVVTWPNVETAIPTCELDLTFPDGGQLRRVLSGRVNYWCNGTPYVEAGFETEQ